MALFVSFRVKRKPKNTKKVYNYICETDILSNPRSGLHCHNFDYCEISVHSWYNLPKMSANRIELNTFINTTFAGKEEAKTQKELQPFGEILRNFNILKSLSPEHDQLPELKLSETESLFIRKSLIERDVANEVVYQRNGMDFVIMTVYRNSIRIYPGQDNNQYKTLTVSTIDDHDLTNLNFIYDVLKDTGIQAEQEEYNRYR